LDCPSDHTAGDKTQAPQRRGPDCGALSRWQPVVVSAAVRCAEYSSQHRAGEEPNAGTEYRVAFPCNTALGERERLAANDGAVRSDEEHQRISRIFHGAHGAPALQRLRPDRWHI
jgi:hypothetical protein